VFDQILFSPATLSAKKLYPKNKFHSFFVFIPMALVLKSLKSLTIMLLEERQRMAVNKRLYSNLNILMFLIWVTPIVDHTSILCSIFRVFFVIFLYFCASCIAPSYNFNYVVISFLISTPSKSFLCNKLLFLDSRINHS